MTEVALPPRLDRIWALDAGRALCIQAGREDLVLAGSAVEEVDALSAGALHHARKTALEHGHALALRAPSDTLLKRLAAHDPSTAAAAPSKPSVPLLERLGAWAWDAWSDLSDAWTFGVTMALGVWSLVMGRERSWPGATWRQLYELGATALGVVVLLTGLIGFTLALLMGAQLQMYGASVHLATLMGVSFVREVGPLLTAVILAGRSGSAIAAELASMAVNQEVDALRTMRANEAAFLVAPRLLAMVVSLPFLSLFASASGILAGLVVAVLQLDIAPATYFQMLVRAVAIKDIVVTLAKSAVFAAIIVFIACRTGLSTRGGSDAVGRATTRTVVMGIFWTVIADCLFSLALYL